MAMLMSMTAGCAGAQTSGAPAPGDTSTTSSGDRSGTQSYQLPRPSQPDGRPTDLPLNGLAPCELFTDAVRQQFELRGTPNSLKDGRGQSECLMQSAGHGGFIITAAHSEGMERFENIPEQLGTARRLTIAGFPAAELRDVHQPSACLIGIDVADGQHLGVYVTDAPKGGTQDEICRNALTFAEAVLASLRQRMGR
jgi:Protein of unknown function (DUF3558)